jgi:glycosyltransferase involved in cell wall biosynthesis
MGESWEVDMKVSVILTTHGKGKYLKQAIASIIAQTFQDWELWIAVDGALESGFLDVLDERIHYAAYYDISVQNRYACTINRTFPKTSGEYLTYLCHDDLYLPWRLEAFAYVLDHNPDVHVVYGQQQMMEERDGLTVLTGVRDTVGVTLNAACQIDHSSVMHRRECFEKVGGWDEAAPMRYGDAYFFKRLNAAGYAFYPLQVPTDCHRYNSESVTYKIDHPEPKAQSDDPHAPHFYPPYDDLGNKRTINNAVDAGWSAEVNDSGHDTTYTTKERQA